MATSLERFETHVDVVDPTDSVVDVLNDQSGLSKQSVKLAMAKGAVWLTRGQKTQRLRRVTRALQLGDQLHLYYDLRVLSETPAEPVLIDDAGAYSVWNKPSGLRSQGSKWGDHCTVVRLAEQRLARTAFIVHRLDRAASGLMVVAHGRRAAAVLSRQFRERAVTKRYRVWVHGDFPHDNSPLRVDAPIDRKPAVSEFRRVSMQGGQSCLDVRIETGRKHQIRRHLAELGYPVVGDRLYGHGKTGDVDLQLSAVELAFHCPVKNVLVSYRLAAWSD